MIYQLAVPGPIEDVAELRLLEWHGGAGRAFAVGELIVELETHKAVIEVRAAQAGVLREVLHGAGDWVAIGGRLAVLSDGPGEALPGAQAALDDLRVEFQIA